MTLALRMRDRGHDVVLISLLDTQAAVREAGLHFLPVCTKAYPAGSLRSLFEPLARLSGDAAMEYTLKLLAALLHEQLTDLPSVLKENSIEGVVLDEASGALGLVPMRLKMPYVTVSNALPFDFTGQTPLCTSALPYDPSPEGLARNRDFLLQMAPFFGVCRDIARNYATKHGVTVDWNDPSGTLSKRLWLAQLPREFDFAATPWPEQFRYAGPFHDGERRAKVAFPWERLTGKQIIYASLGTLQNGLEEIFSTIAEGVGDRAGVQLVLAVGPFLDLERILKLPQDAIVVKQAPQLELIKQATLCITHAGLNTALECLAEGVPMVAIPITNDQPGVAARVTASGVGTTIPLNVLTAKVLRTHVDEALDRPAFRQSARRFMGIIAATDGLNRAVDLLEEAFVIKALASATLRAA